MDICLFALTDDEQFEQSVEARSMADVFLFFFSYNGMFWAIKAI
jgi:hypothetical protein